MGRPHRLRQLPGTEPRHAHRRRPRGRHQTPRPPDRHEPQPKVLAATPGKELRWLGKLSARPSNNASSSSTELENATCVEPQRCGDASPARTRRVIAPESTQLRLGRAPPGVTASLSCRLSGAFDTTSHGASARATRAAVKASLGPQVAAHLPFAKGAHLTASIVRRHAGPLDSPALVREEDQLLALFRLAPGDGSDESDHPRTTTRAVAMPRTRSSVRCLVVRLPGCQWPSVSPHPRP